MDYLKPSVIAVILGVAVIIAAYNFVPPATIAKWMPHGANDAAKMHEAARRQ